MGRRRRKINEHLPKYVYRKRAGFVYRRHGKDTYLCKQTDPPSVLHAAYERVLAQGRENNLRWLLQTYLESAKFKALAARTRSAYEGYVAVICGFKTATGSEFGDAQLEAITMQTIRGYLDKYPAPIAANRHVQFIKAAWNWTAQRHKIPPNPCLGVELNRQDARTRYVTQDEYQTALRLATGYLPVMMELAYLCRARRGEVCALRHSDILEEGLRVIRGKGSEGEITAWTPRLRDAVEAAKRIHPGAPVPIKGGAYLIHDKAGLPIKKNAFDTAWQRLMAKVVAAGGERFTFHDLKARGYSDQKEQWAGHRSERMHRVYNRKLRVVEPPA